MKRRSILILFALFLVAGGVLAQKDCGDGLPCGKLLWDLPALPTFASPTPMPTVEITSVSSATPAPTGAPTATPAPTSTIMADFSDLQHQFETLQAVVAATDVPVIVSGTPMSLEDQYEATLLDTGLFFSYARGISEANFGGFTPFLVLTMTFFTVVIALKVSGFVLPMAAVIFRLVLRIIEVVRKLIGP